MSIARTSPAVGSRRHARTWGQRKMSGKLFGYARVSVASDADANNLETRRRVLADCDQVFEDVGSQVSWNRPGLNRLREALAPGDCVKVATLVKGVDKTYQWGGAKVYHQRGHWPA